MSLTDYIKSTTAPQQGSFHRNLFHIFHGNLNILKAINFKCQVFKNLYLDVVIDPFGDSPLISLIISTSLGIAPDPQGLNLILPSSQCELEQGGAKRNSWPKLGQLFPLGIQNLNYESQNLGIGKRVTLMSKIQRECLSSTAEC